MLGPRTSGRIACGSQGLPHTIEEVHSTDSGFEMLSGGQISKADSRRSPSSLDISDAVLIAVYHIACWMRRKKRRVDGRTGHDEQAAS